MQRDPRNNDDSRKLEKNFCTIHGTGNHSSVECKVIQMTKKKFQLKNKIARASEEIQDQLNPNIYLSSFNIKSLPCKNIFKTSIKINDIVTRGIIDTGADTTFVSLKALGNIPISVTTTKAKATNGNKIEIMGEVRNIRIKISHQSIIINRALVTNNDLTRILIGADTIGNNPFLITYILQKGENNTLKVERFNNNVNGMENVSEHVQTKDRELSKLLGKSESIFQTEITKNTLLTAG